MNRHTTWFPRSRPASLVEHVLSTICARSMQMTHLDFGLVGLYLVRHERWRNRWHFSGSYAQTANDQLSRFRFHCHETTDDQSHKNGKGWLSVFWKKWELIPKLMAGWHMSMFTTTLMSTSDSVESVARESCGIKKTQPSEQSKSVQNLKRSFN